MGAAIVAEESVKLRRVLRQFLREMRRALAGRSGVSLALFYSSDQVRWDDGSVERAVVAVWMDAETGEVVDQRVDKASGITIEAA